MFPIKRTPKNIKSQFISHKATHVMEKEITVMLTDYGNFEYLD